MNKLLYIGLICLLACACGRVQKKYETSIEKPYRSPKLKRYIQKRDLLIYQDLEYVYMRQYCLENSNCITRDSLRRLLAGKMQIDAQGFITRLWLREAKNTETHLDFTLLPHLRRLKHLEVSHATPSELGKIYALQGLQRLTLTHLQARDFELAPLLQMNLDTLEIMDSQVKRLVYPSNAPLVLKHLHLKGNQIAELPKEILFSNVIKSVRIQERHISPAERAFMQANKSSKMRLVVE